MVTRASVEVAREIYADFRLNLPSIFERDTVTIIIICKTRASVIYFVAKLYNSNNNLSIQLCVYDPRKTGGDLRQRRNGPETTFDTDVYTLAYILILLLL